MDRKKSNSPRQLNTRQLAAQLLLMQQQLDALSLQLRRKDLEILQLQGLLDSNNPGVVDMIKKQQSTLQGLSQRIEKLSPGRIRGHPQQYYRTVNKDLVKRIFALEEENRYKDRLIHDAQESFKGRLREIEVKVQEWDQELMQMRSSRQALQRENQLLRLVLRNGTECLQTVVHQNDLLLEYS